MTSGYLGQWGNVGKCQTPADITGYIKKVSSSVDTGSGHTFEGGEWGVGSEILY